MTTDQIIDLILTGYFPAEHVAEANRILTALHERIWEELDAMYEQLKGGNFTTRGLDS